MKSTINILLEKSFLYRSYGHLFLGDYSKGYMDLLEVKKLGTLDEASDYNMILSEGIIEMMERFRYKQAYDLYESSKVLFP
jgi:hypothetical protein